MAMFSGSATPLLADATPVDRGLRTWWTLAAVAALLRVVIMPYGGFPVDIGTFKAWSQAIVENGPAAFYGGGFADYLPGYLYILWIIGELNQLVHFSDQAHLFVLKLPAALADIVTAWAIFGIARRFRSPWALPLAASYLFNPGILFNSAYWGQADAVGAAFALGGVGRLGAGSPIVAAILIAVGAVIKPQTAPVAIPAAIYLFRTLTRPAAGPPRWDLVLGAGAAGVATLVLIMLPFHLSPVGLIGVLRASLSVYPFSSVVAFNFWGATMRFWVGDELRWFGVPHHVIGIAATLAGLTAVAVWTWRHTTARAVVLAAAVALLVTFMLPTRIHERYLLAAIPFVALAAAVDRRMTWVYAGVSVAFALNLLYAYTRPYVETFVLPGWLERTVFSDLATRGWSAINTMMLVLAFHAMFTRREHGSRSPGLDAPQAPAGVDSVRTLQ